MNPLVSPPDTSDTASQALREARADESVVSYPWLHDPIQCRSKIKRLAARAYPSYRGRTFRVEFQKTYPMQNYWDGGTKHYCMGVDLETERILSPHADTTTPFKPMAGSEFEIPPGFAILELCIFQGKNLGISLILSPCHAKEKVSV